MTFCTQLKKVNLDIGLKKTKQILKAVSVMKEDRQPFGGNDGGRSESKRGVLVPCYISAIKHFQIRLIDKIQNIISVYYLIKVSKTCESTPPNEARYGYYVNHEKVVKIKESFKGWFKTVVKFTLPSNSLRPLSIECVNNVNRVISAENCSRDEKG